MKYIAFFPLFFLLCLSANAQPFYSENFSNGFPTGWQTEDESGKGVIWEYCPDGCLFGNLKFNSTSAADGYLISTPKRLFNDPFVTTLTTATIDCSAQSEVFLSFEAFIYTGEISASKGAKLLIKNESMDWMPFDLFPEQQRDSTLQFSYNSDWVRLDISAQAAGFESVQLRWQWTGTKEEFWAIDDVQLFGSNPKFENAIWGTQPGEGDFDGSQNRWVINTIDAPTPSKDQWTWEPIGSLEKSLVDSFIDPFSHHPYLNSYSNENGAMVFNADFFTTDGRFAVSPASYPFYHAELISPKIDLSNVSKEVNVRFDQLVMLGGRKPINFPSATSFTYSLNGGRDWSVPIGINETLPADSLVMNTQEISLVGAAGKPNVVLKFIFAGELYFWAIDDVLVVEKDDNDLRVLSNFYAIAPNAMTPASQVERIGFLADVENFGANPQTDVVLSVRVEDMATQQLVFEDTLQYGTMSTGTIVENRFFKNAFLPSGKSARYQVQYLLTSDSLDQQPDDNSLIWEFEITDSIYAKEFEPTVAIEPIASNNFEYGNVFFIPNGQGHFATSVTFGIANADDQLAGRTLNILLYKFSADENEDGFLNEVDDNLTIVGVGSYTLNGTEKRLSNGIITAPIVDFENLNSGPPVPLTDKEYYLATIENIPRTTAPTKMHASQSLDYLAMWFRQDSLGSPRYAGVEKVGDKFDLFSLGFETVPLIRLNINGLTSSVAESEVQPIISISPNPTTDFFEVKSDWMNISKVELYDASAKLIRNWDRPFGQIFDISDLPKGGYFLKVIGERGWVGEQIIKQ